MRNFLLPLALLAAASPTAAVAGSYSANLAVAPKGKIIARDILWSCNAGQCSGATDYSRPLIVCQSLAKKAGRIEAFRVDGKALAAAELERCNASAKPGNPTAPGNN